MIVPMASIAARSGSTTAAIKYSSASTTPPGRRSGERSSAAPGGAVTSVFGRGGAVAAQAGDYTADKITDGGGKVIMTAAERSKLADVNSYWTSRLTTDPAVLVKTTTLAQHDLRSLLIFYAAPIII